MIKNLNIRQHYWNNPTNRAPRDDHDLTDSVPYPYEYLENKSIFTDKDVLEIGPGRGRQYEKLFGVARHYSICDISPKALQEPVFDGAVNKFHLCDYGDDFGMLFDVVHFWYVLHHIPYEEMGPFFAFVARHLRVGGLAVFNSAQSGNSRGWYTGDGFGTTWMDEYLVVAACLPYLETLKVYCCNERSTGCIFVTRRR